MQNKWPAEPLTHRHERAPDRFSEELWEGRTDTYAHHPWRTVSEAIAVLPGVRQR